MNPPKAKKIEKILSIHGHERKDPYYWLNNRDDEEVINYLNEENEYTRHMLQSTGAFQENLYQEIVGRIKQDDRSVPYQLDGDWFYSRFEEGQEYPFFCRKTGSLEADEEVLLNVNELAEGHNFYQVGGLSLSPDKQWLAFGEDTIGRRIYTIRFKHLETGEIIEEAIRNTTGSAVWANDNTTLFYTVKDETLRPYQVYKYKFQQRQSDTLVYQEDDATFVTFAYKSKSKKYIIIGSGATLSDEYRLISADRPDDEFTIFHPRERELEYSIAHHDNSFYVLTNWKAQNFRLMRTTETATGKENWEEVIPHRQDTQLETIDLFADYMVLSERSNGLTHLRVMNLKHGDDYYISFEEEAYTVYTGTNRDINSDTLRFVYTSLTTPTSVYDFNMTTQSRVLMKEQEVMGGYNKNDYVTRRYHAKATDGTDVPLTLVHRKDLDTAKTNPLLLYGYGSYGITIDPTFSSVRLSLLDRGFIFVIAHIRGGQLLGRPWYEDGKMFTKKNTFTDFIDVAEFLIGKNYTEPEKLFAYGGSAGGLLMGAVINMRPDLFKGVVASVPFVDVVTTMLDDSIPLTTGEYDEWGNPNIKDQYDYILSYSPYDNVVSQHYPNLLVTTGLHDSQVQYWEPAKWVAKLREVKKDDNLLLLYTDMHTGHSGPSGRFAQFRETSLKYTFLLYIAGKITST